MVNGRKVVIIGDRDGIPAQSLEECVRSAGGEVIYSMTHCYV
ncbi:Glycine reductase complex selenoprotein A [Desulfosporosinus orientis DSM 765]|uniref:Glycine reductase complex selenoprotein A n=3 Tax=Desulfosporosinus orientis TaxID=1563 RepID=G7WD02_DESOD|nr:Glycine reductase complex selenoprotein A [Desulfosporosinus orientis DSM 765]